MALQHFATLMKGGSPKVFEEGINGSRRYIWIARATPRNSGDTISLIKAYPWEFAHGITDANMIERSV